MGSNLMKFSVVKLLTAVLIGLLVNGATQNAFAAPSEEQSTYEEIPRIMDEFPRQVQDRIILGTFAVIGAAVFFGTGNSKKQEYISSQKDGTKPNLDQKID